MLSIIWVVSQNDFKNLKPCAFDWHLLSLGFFFFDSNSSLFLSSKSIRIHSTLRLSSLKQKGDPEVLSCTISTSFEQVDGKISS